MGYVAPTLGHAKRIFWTPLMRDLRTSGAEAWVQKVDLADMYVLFRNGAYLRLYSSESSAIERMRGDGFDAVVIDEADDYNFTPYAFNDVITPALADKQGRLLQIGTPKGRGRLYEEHQKGVLGSPLHDPLYASLQVTAITAGILKIEEIERARRTLPARTFRQEYLASFECPVGLVFDEWDDNLHVVDDDAMPKRFDDIIVGVDWGTASRGSMIVIGIDSVWVPPSGGLDGYEAARAWILEEHTHAGMGYDDGGWWAVARAIQARWQPTAWYADPAGGLEGYLKQLARALDGGGASDVTPADNQVRPGIGTVRTFLHFDPVANEPPRLFVHRDAKTLRHELANYRYRSHPTREDEYTDQVVKENDHSIDGVRYALHTHFNRNSGRRRNLH